MTEGAQGRSELHFRRSGRWLLILVILLFPVGVAASKISHLLGSDLVFGVSMAVFMAAFFAVCVWRYVAYCSWTGKYPFYLLSRKGNDYSGRPNKR
jgi:hypothetical protein